MFWMKAIFCAGRGVRFGPHGRNVAKIRSSCTLSNNGKMRG